MSTNATCPLCDRVIDLQGTRKLWPSFRCPHCDQRLRIVVSGTSQAARFSVIGVLTVVFLEGGFGEGAFAFVNWNVAMWSTFAAIVLLNGVISRVFGFTLEPAGRMELGDYDDDAERGDAVKGNER